MASTQSEKDEETRAEAAEERAAASEEEAATDASADSETSGGTVAEGAGDAHETASSDEGETDDSSSSEEERPSEEEEGESEETTSETAAAGAPASRGRKTHRKRERQTAGARLAAAKAAKAARKAAKRGKEKKEQDPLTQVRESEIVKRAQEASSWAADNRNLVLAAAAGLLVLLGGWVGWNIHSTNQTQAAGSALAAAIEIAQAEIVSDEEEGATAASNGDAQTFPSEEARAEAALEAFRRVLSEHGGSDAAIWARLGEADALATLGRHDEAREAYAAAERDGSNEPSVLLRAMEGRAFTFEAEQQWDRALEVYQQLANTDNRRYEAIAQYHIARMHIAKGERERATETLRGVVDKLTPTGEEQSAQPRFDYIRTQAQMRLAELDPSAAPARRGSSLLGGGAGMPGELSEEQIQELIRQFQLKQQQEQQGSGGE